MINQNIALYGKAGSGKTTLAYHLNERRNYEILSFATPLKELATVMLGRPISKSIDRSFLINLGAYLKGLGNMFCSEEEFKRLEDYLPDLYTNPMYFKEDVWVNLLLKRIKPERKYVIDDLRFQVEYDALKKAGFVFGYIECPHNVCEARMIERDGGFNPKIWSSPSETEHVSFVPNVIVVSTGTEEETYKSFVRMLDDVSTPGYEQRAVIREKKNGSEGIA